MKKIHRKEVAKTLFFNQSLFDTVKNKKKEQNKNHKI